MTCRPFAWVRVKHNPPPPSNIPSLLSAQSYPRPSNTPGSHFSHFTFHQLRRIDPTVPLSVSQREHLPYERPDSECRCGHPFQTRLFRRDLSVKHKVKIQQIAQSFCMLGARRSIFRRAHLLLPMFVTWQLMAQLFPFAKNKTGTVLVRLSWDAVFLFGFLLIFSCRNAE